MTSTSSGSKHTSWWGKIPEIGVTYLPRMVSSSCEVRPLAVCVWIFYALPLETERLQITL